MIIMSPKQSLGDILCLLRFLLHHPDCCRVMYCYSMFLFHYYYSYYVTPNAVGWRIAILRFFFTIITSPRLLSDDVLLFYISFSLLLLRHPERSQVTYCYSTFLFHYYYYSYYYYYSSTHFCPLYFSEMPKGQNFMIIIHEILSINYLPFKD
jgi:hypothetical protein